MHSPHRTRIALALVVAVALAAGAEPPLWAPPGRGSAVRHNRGHAVAGRPGQLDTRLPDRRLADSGRADDCERAGAAIVPGEEGLDDRDLGLASDDRCHRERVVVAASG
jgi:hypothetical protein